MWFGAKTALEGNKQRAEGSGSATRHGESARAEVRLQQ